jgi:hypothetical protein
MGFAVGRQHREEASAAERALESWRIVAGRVWSRWDAFLASPRDRRASAFAAYAAALDGEAAAAQRVADLGVP